MLLARTDAKLIGAIVLLSARPVTLITVIKERLLASQVMHLVHLIIQIVHLNARLGLAILDILNQEALVSKLILVLV